MIPQNIRLTRNIVLDNRGSPAATPEPWDTTGIEPVGVQSMLNYMD